MRPPREHFQRLNATLLPQLSTLVKEWLPAGRAAGAEWTALNPRRHDQRPGSFRVNLRSGRWADFATGEGGGDPVSLYAYLFTDGRQGAAVRALDGGRIAVRPMGAAKVAKAANPDADEARRVARASVIYAAAGPIGGPAEAYLINRGLRPVPAWTSLRTAVLRHPDAGEHPAVVAPVTGTSGALEGIQRTFLTVDGRKLPVRDPKLSLGRVRVGAIRLGDPAAELVLCEGLEDGLSLAQELPGSCVWAAPGAGMLAAMCLPPIVSIVVIAADNDAAGEQAARRAAERFASKGRQVRIMRPDPAYKDWNDQLRGIAR
ncbi:toprim domain-containing protein [uncultured Sphingomonas sp.]|uniref:toprim domain-containing protein n=1 Tax=uncultured Sphingomonas sp. TaxID=158754 RepID=UPI0025975BDD|nr:toprim domain-containing protein [uncultured Sphingomonas sp.]